MSIYPQPNWAFNADANMAKYSVAITQTSDKVATIKLLRTLTVESVAAISQRIGTTLPVIEFDTWGFPLTMLHDTGVPYQHKKITDALSSLTKVGASFLITHNAGSITEVVSEEMLKNLFESELIYLAQEHD